MKPTLNGFKDSFLKHVCHKFSQLFIIINGETNFALISEIFIAFMVFDF